MPKPGPSLEETRLRLESLVDIIQRMITTIEPDELVKVILNSVKRLFAAEGSSIALIDEETRQLTFAFSAGGAEVGRFRLELGQGIIGSVAQTGEGIVCKDVSQDPRFFGGIDSRTGYRTTSLLCAPLNKRGETIGAIELVNLANPETLDEADLRLLSVFGGLAGSAIERARRFATTANANLIYQELAGDRYRFIMGSNQAMKEAVELAQTVAATNTTVLLLGETGTGKEIFARFIHQRSPRSDHPFIPINCVALNPDLIESELFGHEKGSFTGAGARKIGKFELANGGTVFLDEIGELTPKLQTKLLRVLQEKEFQRIGGTKDIRADVRIVAATNRDLREAIRVGDFREDLYYRLNVVSLLIPPLRDRVEDVPALVTHFVERFCGEVKRPVLSVDPDAMNLLQSCSWPGNVRQLQNAIERAVVLSRGNSLSRADFSAEIREPQAGLSGSVAGVPEFDSSRPMAEAIDQMKRALVKSALVRTNGNQAEAAKLLGVQRANLSRLMKALGLR